MLRKGPRHGGDLYSWGSGEMGQLGFPRLEDLPKDQDGYPYQPVAQQIETFNKTICHVAGGDGHAAAVLSTGRLFTWGASACGQLGHSDTEAMPKDVEGYPYQPVPRLVDILKEVWIESIACGDAHTVAVTRDGRLFAWGGGGCGQLGHSETEQMPKDEDGCPYQPTPREVTVLGTPVRGVACGKAHTVAVARDGRLFTWGAGACGQLGHPDTSTFPSDEDGYPFQPTPREVASMSAVASAKTTCGDVHTLVLTSEGRVYAFGGGVYGQLGIPDVHTMPVDADQCPYTPTPQLIPALERITALACGDSHALAIDEDGVAYCWGANSCGQLGLRKLDELCFRKESDGIPHLPVPLPIDALEGIKISAIACGEAHSLAVSAIGDLYSWGACSCGQLGVGSYVGLPMDNDGYPYQSMPTRVDGFGGKAVVAVACGGVHNLAMTEPDTTLVTNLADLVLQEPHALSDVVIHCKNGEACPAHLCILQVRAPRMAELVKDGVAHLSGTSVDILRELLYFIYTDDLDSFVGQGPLGSLLELHELCSRFGVGLVHACRRALQAKLGQSREEVPLEPPEPDGWGVVFLPGGHPLALDAATYADLLSKGRRLDLAEGQPPVGRPAEEAWQDLLQNSVCADVVLRVDAEGGPVVRSAHKVILAVRSAYFRVLVSSDFIESSQEEVQLDVSEAELDALLAFIYCDEWSETIAYAVEMLPIADRFSTLDLKRNLERFLIVSLTAENWEHAAQIFDLADRYNCPRLRGRAISYITLDENFNAIVKTQGFAELEKRLILEVLQHAHAAPQPGPSHPGETFPGHSATKNPTDRKDMHRRGWLTYNTSAGDRPPRTGRTSPARRTAPGAAEEEEEEASDAEMQL